MEACDSASLRSEDTAGRRDAQLGGTQGSPRYGMARLGSTLGRAGLSDAEVSGISKNGESSRLAVQTEIHPISYTLHEGE
jgi:hypothetical protein